MILHLSTWMKNGNQMHCTKEMFTDWKPVAFG